MLAVGAIVLLYLGSYQLPGIILAQQTSIDEAVKAVVRIVPQRCSSTGCQPLSVGSGAIIHPAGIILTAWHVTVTDPENLITPIYADDFIIEMTEDVRRRPQPRYRAELIAVKPDMDLALLRIYQEIDTNQPVALNSSNNLPTLSISDNIPSSGQLRIMGYPPAGGDSIKYPNLEMSGFADDGALLTVQGTLSEGYSGGPVLYEQDGRLAIVGIVIRRRGELGEVGLIRSIDQLRRLEWLPNATRVWGENGQVTIGQNSGNSILQIQLNLHTLDFIEEHGRLLAYTFDAATGQPWITNESSFDRSTNGHLVLKQEFSATSIVQQTTVTLLSGELDEQYNLLAFKLLLWDTDETRVLWRDNQWYRPQIVAAQVALVSTPPPVPTNTSIVINTPTATETSLPTPTLTETSTPTAQPTTRQSPTGIVAVQRLNLRQGPGTNFPVIGTVSNGETVTILSRNSVGDWWYVCCVSGATQEGWAAAQFIRPNFDLDQADTLIPVDNRVTNISTPTRASISIEPISPNDGDSGSRQRTFTWSANFTLNDGYAFELVFWKPGEDPLKQSFGMADATTDLSVILDLERLDEQLGGLFDIGEYNWGVLLVRTTPSYERMQYLGGGRRFIYKRESNSGSSAEPCDPDSPLCK
jgi:uncharacterized protein YraI